MAIISIELPEELAVLVEEDPFLRRAIEDIVKKEVTEYLLTIMALDNLTETSRLSEEDVLKLGKLVKRAVREKWDAKGSGGY